MKDKVTKSHDTVPLGKIGITTTKNRSTNLKRKVSRDLQRAFYKKKTPPGPHKNRQKTVKRNLS